MEPTPAEQGSSVKDAAQPPAPAVPDIPEEAAQLFIETEGNDVDPAAAVAVASLIKAVQEGKVEKEATIMLNITGGGMEKFKKEHIVVYAKPHMIFPINPDLENVKAALPELFK